VQDDQHSPLQLTSGARAYNSSSERGSVLQPGSPNPLGVEARLDPATDPAGATGLGLAALFWAGRLFNADSFLISDAD